MRVWKNHPNISGIKVEITFDESAAMYTVDSFVHYRIVIA